MAIGVHQGNLVARDSSAALVAAVGIDHDDIARPVNRDALDIVNILIQQPVYQISFVGEIIQNTLSHHYPRREIVTVIRGPIVNIHRPHTHSFAQIGCDYGNFVFILDVRG